MNSYQHAKDNRTDEEYKESVEAGIKKQNKVLEEIGIPYKLVREEEFSKEVPKYQPDCYLKISNKWIPCEVKVSCACPRFDLKRNQIDKLIPIGGIILYVMEDEWTIFGASWIKKIGLIINAEDSYINKESYRVRKEQFVWNKKD